MQMKSHRISVSSKMLTRLLAVLFFGGVLASCSEQPSGPVTGGGASYGSLGSQDMSDYYYHKTAGYTYVFSNVQNFLDDDGNVTATYTGANDTVRTLGYDAANGPNGDSLYRIQITYRVDSAYAGRQWMNIYYVGTSPTNGGFLTQGTNPSDVPGCVFMGKPRPRPVSTDTILAGIAGYVRTQTDDFTNASGHFKWQTDTLWFTSHGDSTIIWERFFAGGPLRMSRLIFCKNFTNNSTWTYDQIDATTIFTVNDKDQQVTVPAGTYNHCVKIDVRTSKVSDDIPITEKKWFACGTGIIKQYDKWATTTDGQTFQMQDFTRSLISITSGN